MKFTRSDLEASHASLLASSDTALRAIGENFAVEENVGAARLVDFHDVAEAPADLRAAADDYFRVSVQGNRRGHPSSTFDPALNGAALLPATVEANQKIVRLERIDSLISSDPGLGFDRLEAALKPRDNVVLAAFANLFNGFPGERPMYAVARSEMAEDLKAANWLDRLIARLGLYHHFPIATGETYSFALMENLAKDVFDAAEPRLIRQPFALATVLECRNNPAFFPVPSGGETGFTVGLDAAPARELLPGESGEKIMRREDRGESRRSTRRACA